jgi:nicotinamidase-related amidase
MGSRHILEADRSVLVVVDIQEKLSARMAERDAVVAATRSLIAAARRLRVPVIVTEQYPRGIGPTAPELVTALEGEYAPIEKLSFGCAREPAFMARFKALGRTQVALCGMEAHICVLQTALGLLEAGCAVHVAADAVCSRSAENKRIGLELVREAGAAVTCWETVVFQWLEKAGTPEFKDLLPLFK